MTLLQTIRTKDVRIKETIAAMLNAVFQIKNSFNSLFCTCFHIHHSFIVSLVSAEGVHTIHFTHCHINDVIVSVMLVHVQILLCKSQKMLNNYLEACKVIACFRKTFIREIIDKLHCAETTSRT